MINQCVALPNPERNRNHANTIVLPIARCIRTQIVPSFNTPKHKINRPYSCAAKNPSSQSNSYETQADTIEESRDADCMPITVFGGDTTNRAKLKNLPKTLNAKLKANDVVVENLLHVQARCRQQILVLYHDQHDVLKGLTCGTFASVSQSNRHPDAPPACVV